MTKLWWTLMLALGLSACAPDRSAISCEDVSDCFEGEVCSAGLCRTLENAEEDVGDGGQSPDGGDAADDDGDVDTGVDAPAGVAIRLSWVQPDWTPDSEAGPDLDLHYCNERAVAFTEETQEPCVNYTRRSGDWSVGDDEVRVDLVNDSTNPDGTEAIEHAVMQEGVTHVAVHYYDDFGLTAPVQALLEISIDGGEFEAVETPLHTENEVWYAARIDWGAEGGPAIEPGPGCLQDCSEDAYYMGFPVEIP